MTNSLASLLKNARAGEAGGRVVIADDDDRLAERADGEATRIIADSQ